PDQHVAVLDGVAVAGDDHLGLGGGDLERGGEVDGRLGAEVLADGHGGERVAAPVGGAARIGGAGAGGIVRAGGEADGGGRGEGGGEQRAAADHEGPFGVGSPGPGARGPGYGSRGGDELNELTVRRRARCSGDGRGVRCAVGAADLGEQRLDLVALGREG